MARKKKRADLDDELRGKPRRRAFLGGLFHFLMFPAVRYFILLVIIVALLFWKWSNLVELFGGGLVLMAIAVGIVIIWIWRWKLSSFILRGNRWLAGVAFILAIWGILAFLNLGGSFGLSIISYPKPNIGGILTLL